MNRNVPGNPIRSIAIVGGGTAGWMAAAALARSLAPNGPSIVLIESDALGTVGVGEATIPPIRELNALLGIDEDEFVRVTGATFKLGISFEGWRHKDHRYFHPFGRLGADIGPLPFHHYWQALAATNPAMSARLDAYSLPAMAAASGKFCRPSSDPRNTLSNISYAFHFDASLYARLLRQTAERAGVARREGKIVAVDRGGADGDRVSRVVLDDGSTIAADLFIDCSGFTGLLIEGALSTGYEDWSHWLPCDSALAMATTRVAPAPPYTRSIAGSAGWQWRIPLQHRMGNGHVFASRFMERDIAERILRNSVTGKPTTEARLLTFIPGRRKKAWNGNVVAMGLAAGFLEPLESTSIHLIQSAVTRLIALFPDRAFAAADIAYYNRATQFEYERIRDFIILHYYATERCDGPFWNYVRTMTIPDTLMERIELYRSRGRFFPEAFDLFLEPSWLAVMHGQGLTPEQPDPLALSALDGAVAVLPRIREAITRAVAVMPTHADFIHRHCATPEFTG